MRSSQTGVHSYFVGGAKSGRTIENGLLCLDRARIISSHLGFPLPGDPHKEKQSMKALRILFLMVGLLCAGTALATPAMTSSLDGAPPAYCPPGSGGHCR